MYLHSPCALTGSLLRCHFVGLVIIYHACLMGAFAGQGFWHLQQQTCSIAAGPDQPLCALLQSHQPLLEGITALTKRVQEDKGLVALIRRKFAIKCTTGYSLNALVDFPADDPLEIIKRLMVGSEGTLGFVSQATYNTVPEWPHKVPQLPSMTFVDPSGGAACSPQHQLCSHRLSSFTCILTGVGAVAVPTRRVTLVSIRLSCISAQMCKPGGLVANVWPAT